MSCWDRFLDKRLVLSNYRQILQWKHWQRLPMSGCFAGSFTASIRRWIGPNARERLSLGSWILLVLKFLRYSSSLSPFCYFVTVVSSNRFKVHSCSSVLGSQSRYGSCSLPSNRQQMVTQFTDLSMAVKHCEKIVRCVPAVRQSWKTRSCQLRKLFLGGQTPVLPREREHLPKVRLLEVKVARNSWLTKGRGGQRCRSCHPEEPRVMDHSKGGLTQWVQGE